MTSLLETLLVTWVILVFSGLLARPVVKLPMVVTRWWRRWWRAGGDAGDVVENASKGRVNRQWTRRSHNGVQVKAFFPMTWPVCRSVGCSVCWFYRKIRALRTTWFSVRIFFTNYFGFINTKKTQKLIFMCIKGFRWIQGLSWFSIYVNPDKQVSLWFANPGKLCRGHKFKTFPSNDNIASRHGILLEFSSNSKRFLGIAIL